MKLYSTGTTCVGMSAWTVKDLAGKSWKLDSLGTLAAGQEKPIKRSGQPMALNNGGDTIDLISPDGQVVQTVSYGRADVEEVIFPAH